MIPSPYSRKAARPEGARRGRSTSGTRSPRSDRGMRTFSPPSSPRDGFDSPASPRQPLSPKSQSDVAAPVSPPWNGGLKSLADSNSLRGGGGTGTPRQFRVGAGQQENENDEFSPQVFEQDLLMSVSTLIDHFRNQPDGRGAMGASPRASASASASSSRGVSSSLIGNPHRQLTTGGSLVLDEVTLRNVSLFARMLQRSDAGLANELDHIVRALSGDDQSTDVTSLTMGRETCQALEAYIDAVSGRRKGPSPEGSNRRFARASPVATSTRGLSPRSAKSSPAKIQNVRAPRPDVAPAVGTIARVSDSESKTNMFSFLGRFVDAVSETLNPEPDTPSDPVAAETTPVSGDAGHPPAVEHQDSGIGGFRSASDDSMERFRASPKSVDGEQVTNMASDDSMIRFNHSPYRREGVPLLTDTLSVDHAGLVQEESDVGGPRSLLSDDNVSAVSPAHDGTRTDAQKKPTSPQQSTSDGVGHAISSWNSGIGIARSTDELLSPTLSNEDIDQKANAFHDDMEAMCERLDSSCSEHDIVIDVEQPTDAVEVLPSETFTSNDLDTVALSILGHYIDKVAASPDTKANSKRSVPRMSPTIVFDDPVQALRFEQHRGNDEPEHDPVVELCESNSFNDDGGSQPSTDLTSFAPAVAAAKAAMEAVSTTPRRQKVDPPSVTAASSGRSDPPTRRSPRKVDVDLTLLPSYEDEPGFPLTVEVKSPSHGKPTSDCCTPKRDPDVTNEPPLIDTTGELNPRLLSPISSPRVEVQTGDRSGVSPSVSSSVDGLGPGHSIVSKNSPSAASSIDRGSVKIIFFDKTKPKKKRSKRSTGIDQPPISLGEGGEALHPDDNESQRGARTLPHPESPISIGGQNSFRRAPPTNPASDTIGIENALPSPCHEAISSAVVGRPESSSVLEPIAETPTLENTPAPTLSVGTMPDDVPFSVSALRHEMGSSEAEASVVEEEKKLDGDGLRGDMQAVLEHTNTQMRDLISQSDPDETVRKLWNLIPQPETKPSKGKSKPDGSKNFSFEKFAALIDMTFPFFDGRMPTPVEKAHLQVQARRKEIPVAMTNALMDTLLTLAQSEAALDILPMPKSIHDLSTSEYSSIRKEALLRRLLRLKEAERRRDVMIYSTAVSTEEEAVEIDLSGLFQFAMTEYESSSDESVDEPWWKSTAKLYKVLERSKDSDDLGFATSSSRDYYDTETDTDNDSLAHNTKKVPSVEDEIRGFWKTRKRRPKYYRLRHRGGGLPSVGTASFSANENDGTSTSASSVSTSRYDREVDVELWARKRDIAMWPNGPNGGWLSRLTSNNWIQSPEPINAVNATVYFVLPSFIRRRCNPGTKQWELPYEPRISPHKGYFHVNVKSLFDASSQYGIQHPQDLLPWERRDVKQRFLQEQSVSYNRNWFGTTKKVYGNDRLRQPVCRPKSMEMPMKAGEWTEEWYRKPWDSLSLAQSLSAGDADLKEIAAMRRRYVGTDDEEDISWEETPECGTIRNVKLKIGERVTRVTPDITCSLRRSRWRKKFFPKGTFPY